MLDVIWTAKELSEALGIRVIESIKANEVHFNSKDVKEGDLFIALPGKTDSHAYVKDAIARGASAVIVTRLVEGIDKSKLILVQNTLEALEKLASYKRNTTKAKVIAITGSVGKTSTKEGMCLAFKGFAKCFASRANFNNNLGLLINLASIPSDAEYIIQELGMSSEGELEELSKLLRPDYAIITNVSPAHIEFFKDIYAIADAKSEIVQGLNTEKGVAVLNGKISCFDYLKQKVESHGIKNIKVYGTSDIDLINYTGSYAEYKILEQIIKIKNSNIGGRHLAENLTCVLYLCYILGFNLEKVAENLSSYKPYKGRGKKYKINIDQKSIELIDESYNAVPEAMKAALLNLGSIAKNIGRKIAVIGDMLELGNYSKNEHEKLAGFINGIDKVITYGDAMKNLYDILPAEKKVEHFTNLEDLKKFCRSFIQNNDTLMIKSSKGKKTYEVVEFLLKEAQEYHDL